MPSGLNEDMTTAAVAGLGDGSPSASFAGGVLPGHKPEIGHELSGSLEATPVADLGDQGHGGERADASEAGEPLDLGAVGVREGDFLDLTIEIVAATNLVVHERQILAEDRTVL